jgi:hypothetical protein
MQRINVNLFPKTGFIFKESDGTTIAGNTWAGVVSRVRAYRKRAGLPPGDPESEVRAQACQREPTICNEDDGQHAAAVKVASLKSRVLQWFASIRKSSKRDISEFVSFEKAQERANICAGCQFNQALPEGCSSCSQAIKELRQEVIGGRHVDSRLVNHGCSVLGSDLATQAWLDLLTVNQAELPGHCWRKRTL